VDCQSYVPLLSAGAGLGEITGNNALDMSWKNYQENIVDEYKVVLDGWPMVVFDPSKLGYRALEPIMRSLEEGSCKWQKLIDDEYMVRRDELIANGGTKKAPLKERADKGKKRGLYNRNNQVDVEDDDEKSSTSSSSEDD
jgi:hypothetical protein